MRQTRSNRTTSKPRRSSSVTDQKLATTIVADEENESCNTGNNVPTTLEPGTLEPSSKEMNKKAGNNSQTSNSDHLSETKEIEKEFSFLGSKPMNGQDCFFSEATFRRVMGPEPTFEERLRAQIARAEQFQKEQSKSKPKKKVEYDRPEPQRKATPVPDFAEELQKLKSDRVTEESSVVTSHDGASNEEMAECRVDLNKEAESIDQGTKAECNTKHQDRKNKTDRSNSFSLQSTDNTSSYDKDSDDEDTLCIAIPAEQSTPVKSLNSAVISPTANSTIASPTAHLNIVSHNANSTIDVSTLASTAEIPQSEIISGKLIRSNTTSEEVVPVEQNIPLTSIPTEAQNEEQPSIQNRLDEPIAGKESVQEKQPLVVEEQQSTHAKDTVPEELCLIMPPLSSDEEDDSSIPNPFDSLYNDGEAGKITLTSEQDILTNQETQQEIIEPVSVASSKKMDGVLESFYTLSNQAVTDQPNSGKPSGTIEIQEEDIPIFSVKESSPQPGKERKPNTVWDQGDDESVNFNTKGDPKAKEEVKKKMKFQLSDLTKAEHKEYLKLFNKFVKPYLYRNRPPLFTQGQMKEYSAFEKLHGRVVKEQQLFQRYLWEQAQANPKPYMVIKSGARSYCIMRMKNHRLDRWCVSQFSPEKTKEITLKPPGKQATDLLFVQTLLKIGSQPKVSIPNIEDGQKPIPLPTDETKVNQRFPMLKRKPVQGCISDETVSRDPNAQTLVRKYGVDIVMSSSVVKCLMDNQGPDYSKLWNIPVKVFEVRGENRKVVYLEKPLADHMMTNMEMNIKYHKYALRTFMTTQRQRKTKGNPNPRDTSFSQDKRPSFTDTPFDMFSSDIDSIETFGAGAPASQHSNLSRFYDTAEKGEKTGSAKSSQEKASPKDPTGFNAGQNQRSVRSQLGKKKALTEYIDLDSTTVPQISTSTRNEVGDLNKKEDGANGHSAVNDNGVSSVKKARLSIEEESTPGVKKLRSSSRLSVSNQQPDKKTADVSLTESADPGAEKQEQGKETTESDQDTKKITVLSPNESSQVTTRQLRKRESTQQSTSDSSTNKNSKSSVDAEPINGSRYTPVSPELENKSLTNIDTPQIPEAQGNPCNLPSQTSKPASFFKFTPMSPVNEPPLQESSSSSPSPVAVKRSTRQDQSRILSTDTSFNPLESILGTSFLSQSAQEEQKKQEDPGNYNPPAENNSSLAYNLWTLGSLRVLIRCHLQGMVREQAKIQAVYLTPKLEYQPQQGHEQVTLSEAIRGWTACYIRPHTNLLRTRINAFSSEIMRIEELEPSQILYSAKSFQPQEAFTMLHQILSELTKLECGRYLLNHKPGQPFCSIHKGKGGGKKKEQWPQEELEAMWQRPVPQVPWVPIDPTLLLSTHVHFHRVPGTFWPKDGKRYEGNQNGSKGAGQGGGGGKKGKKQNKRNKNNSKNQDLKG